jgi:ABC-type proline/glycine betaine transport system substrate-binding protein
MKQSAKSAFIKSAVITALFPLFLTACGNKEAGAPDAAAPAATAAAGEAATCGTVKFADIGWTDITATTALSSTVLEGLGYKAESTIASVPIAFAGLKKGQIDAFLGYWSPSMSPIVDPFLKELQYWTSLTLLVPNIH